LWIRKKILPFFELFDRPNELRDLLLQYKVPKMHVGRVVDFLLCFYDRQAAETAASAYLARHRRLKKPYLDELRRFEETELPFACPSAYASCLAYLTIMHDLRIQVG
jgi:hypothetical protein